MDIVKKTEASFCCEGGWKCRCCGPKGKKEKRIIRKKARKKFKNLYMGLQFKRRISDF